MADMYDTLPYALGVKLRKENKRRLTELEKNTHHRHYRMGLVGFTPEVEQSFHDRRLARRMEDEEFRTEFERCKWEIQKGTN